MQAALLVEQALALLWRKWTKLLPGTLAWTLYLFDLLRTSLVQISLQLDDQCQS